MAFGLGYNKAKILGAAEKFVMQGKIPAALAEYSKILQNEPRDLTILNIVGDLLLRISKTEDALKCFYKLGEAYLDDGFTRNAIAIYRRILRADPAQLNAILRLAELYTLQGQLGEARGYYHQAIEHYTRRNETEKCVEIMEKTLLLDPDNLSIKQRLATLYQQANRKEEAAGLYLAVAEGLADQGKTQDADKTLKTAKQLGASGPQLVQLEARILFDSGQPEPAIARLAELAPESLDKAALNLLFHAYSQIGDHEQAAAIAGRLLTEHEDVAGMAMICEQLLQQSRYEDALAHYQDMAGPLLELRNISPLVDGVKRIAEARPDDLAPWKLLRDVYQKSERYDELATVDEHLAAAAEQLGDTALARDVYTELARLHPESSEYVDKLRELSGAPARVEAEAERAEVGFGEEMYAAPVVEQRLTAQEQELLHTALNESDLYVNYRQIEKAIRPLETLLGRLPTNIALNERLMELYQRSGAAQKAAERCAVLASVYAQGGDEEKAGIYESLVQKYSGRAGAVSEPGVEEQAGLAPSPLPEFTMAPEPAASAAGVSEEAPGGMAAAPSEAGVQEVDLSDWEAMLAPSPAAPPTPAAAGEPGVAGAPPPAITDLPSGAAQIDAYLAAGQIAEATTALSELQEHYAGAPELELLAEKVAMAAMGMTVESGAAGVALPPVETTPPEPIFAPFEMAGTAGEQPAVQEFQFPELPVADVSAEAGAAPVEEQPDVWIPAPEGEVAAVEPVALEATAAAEPAAEVPPPLPEEIPAAVPAEEPVIEAVASPAAEPATQWPEPVGLEAPAEELPAPVLTEQVAPEPQVAEVPGGEPAVAAAPAEAPAPDVDLVLHLERQTPPAEEAFELSLEEEAPAARQPRQPVSVPPAPPAVAAAAESGFDSLVGALDQELAGIGQPPAPPPAATASAVAASASVGDTPPPAFQRPPQQAGPAGAGALADVFEEFKEGMEEPGSEADVDTHLNMGVAFKEMQLWDEAIGEFQKAYQAAERTKNYGGYVRCCTLLAHCFQEKGMPALSVRWLENALKAPKLEQEVELALRYEIGVAHQMAGNRKAALESFLEVYALNIDYRDVAERIRELQGN